jgi:hypothetical protein
MKRRIKHNDLTAWFLKTTLRFRLAILKAARNFLTRLASVKLQAQAASNKRQAAAYTNNKINISTNHE